MQLLRATEENGLFNELETQWKGQLAKYDETIDDYISPFRDHCKQAIGANHNNYFVYILEDGGAYEGFIHVNYARIKRLPDYTLRALEIFLAPIYDFEDIPPQKMSDIVAGIVTNLMKLGENDLLTKNIKIHVGPLDKTYLSAFAQLYIKQQGVIVEMQGSWLLITTGL